MPCQTQAHRLLLSGILDRYPGSSLFECISHGTKAASAAKCRGDLCTEVSAGSWLNTKEKSRPACSRSESFRNLLIFLSPDDRMSGYLFV